MPRPWSSLCWSPPLQSPWPDAEFTVKADAKVEVAALTRDLTGAVRAEPGNVAFDPYVLRLARRGEDRG
ncbi:MAG: hypothetical protein ABJA81_01820 [Nocardioidaceae bacterium]